MKLHSSRSVLPALLAFSLVLFASVDGAKATQHWIAVNATSNYTVVIGNGSQSTVTFQWTHMGNGSVRIDGFNGNGTFNAATPLIPHPDIDTRPPETACNTCGPTSDRTFNSYTFVPGGPNTGPNSIITPSFLNLSPGYLFFDTDTNTVWEFVEYLRDSDNVITDWQWKVHNTGDARLGQDTQLSLGTIVREQDDTGVVYYQKIANPGTSASDWMKVNFEIPKYVEVNFTMNASVGGRNSTSNINTTPALVSPSNYTVTEIATGAFQGNANLLSVALPSTLTSIGNRTFFQCAELGSFNDEGGIFIPAGVTNIGSQALGRCKALKSILVHELNPSYSWLDGVLYNIDRTELVQYPSSKLGMTYTVPPTIKEILPYAVEANPYIVLVEMGDSVEKIGADAFRNLDSLVVVRFGKGVGSANGTIGDNAFADCYALGSAVFAGASPANIGNNVFNNADAGFTIQHFASYDFTAWTDAKKGLAADKTLGGVFGVTLIDQVGDFTFLTDATTGMTTLMEYKGTGGNVTIPSVFGNTSVREIFKNAFLGKIGITSVSIPNSVSKIGANAFRGVTTLANVTFGSGLSSIGDSAFMDCDELTSVNINPAISSLGNGTFSSCDKLGSIIVDKNNPTFRSVNQKNIETGVVFSKDLKEIYAYPAGKSDSTYTIPDGIQTVRERAFEGNVYLAQVEIPNSVTTIGVQAFYNTLALSSVRLGTGVTTINKEAFAGLVSPLISATFLGNKTMTVNQTGTGIFGGALGDFKVYCLPQYKLGFGITGNSTNGTWTPDHINYPNSSYPVYIIQEVDDFEITENNGTATIKKYSGLGDTITPDTSISLDSLPVDYTFSDIFATYEFFYNNPLLIAQIGDYVYDGVSKKIYIVAGNDDGNRAFVLVTRLNLPSTVTIPLGQTVGEQDGSVYQKIANPGTNAGDWIKVDFEIPETLAGLQVTSIQEGAFEDKDIINSVVLPTSVKTLGDHAFRGCDNITAVFLPSGVIVYGNGTFANCGKLEKIYVDSGNTAFTSTNYPDINYGVLFDKTMSTIVQYPAGRQVSYYTTPSTVKTIKKEAFAGNMYLNYLKTADACETIEKEAFNGSMSLANVALGNGVKNIYEGAFTDISSLAQVTFQGKAPTLWTISSNGSVISSNGSVGDCFDSNAKIRYYPGTSGWVSSNGTISIWSGLVTPIGNWNSGLYKTTNGFRAVGTIDQAVFNNDLGGLIDISVNRNGIATGAIRMVGTSGVPATHRFIKGLDDEGALSVAIKRRGESDLLVNLELDVTLAPSQFTFLASSNTLSAEDEIATISANSVSWNAKNPATPYQGYYTVGLETAAADLIPKIGTKPVVSKGHGFLALNVAPATGAMRFSGVLADGTKVTGSSVVDGVGGVPMFIPLYTSKGTLFGEMSISKATGKPVAADLSWSKPAGVLRSPNASGFDNVSLTAIAGSGAFTIPTTANFNPITLKFSASNWSGDPAVLSDFNQGFEVSMGRISPKSPIVNGVTATWNLRTGLFQGAFKDSLSRTGLFQGVMLNNGAGLKLRGNFQLPNTATSPTYYLGGTVEN
jgi:hypothetical protein